MIKKTTFLKTLLVAAGLLVGASNVWAEGEWSIDFAALGANYDDKTGVTISETVATIGGTTMGTCTVSGDALNSNFLLQTGTTWLMRKANGLYQGNGGGRAMGMKSCTEGQIITIVGTGNPNPSTNVTLKNQDGNTYIYTVNADGDVKFTPARYLYFTSISVTNPSATSVSYTVKYVDELGVEIKDATTGDGEAGDGITLSVLEKASFLNEGGTKKYIYKSDDSEGKIIEADGSTVVTITFREAATWNYTLNSSLGTKITDGSGFEDDVLYVGYPRYILQGTTLYEAAATNKEYRKTVTLDADNKVETVTYTATSMTNVIFYSEGEAISGITEVTFGNVAVRASNALAAKTDADVDITTLPAGKYIFTVGAFTSKSGDYDGFAVKIGIGAEVFSADVSYANLNVLTSEEYAVTDGTAIKFLAEGCGDNSALDYIIIQQTAASVAIKTTGTTFSSAYAVDCANLPSGVKAYKVSTVAGGKATAEEVTEAVKAETGLILVATAAGNYNIPVAASGSDISATNLLKAAVTEKTVAANEAYGLSEGKFYLLEAGTIPAGKAYLLADDIATAPELSIVFGGEATGINEVQGSGLKVNGYYNLNGQRVAQPTKGLYIVNGHKVVIK